MNTVLNIFLLLLVPGLPLLLVFPVLRLRMSWTCYLALLPAAILVAVPTVVSIEIPWLLFGSGLGIDGVSRLLLAMSVVLWAVAIRLHAHARETTANHFVSFFLLAMAGNLGLIVSTDAVGFFTFSTFMSLGFYGLLVDGGAEPARRAGRIYISFMILADLVLLDALLIAAASTEDLSFEAVRQAMAQSATSGLYLSIVLLGFAARAGVWPLHSWLPLAFRSSPPMVALLLAGVPVVSGLLGIVRWLPLGEITSPELGFVIQGLGVAAMFYAILAGLKWRQLKMLPGYATIFATGLFFIAIGAALSDPATWKQYGNLVCYFIATLGLGLAVLVIVSSWPGTKYLSSVTSAKPADDLTPWFEHWSGIVVSWLTQMGLDTLPRWRRLWLVKLDNFLQVIPWQKVLDTSEHSLHSWPIVVALLTLMSISIAFLST